MENDQTNKSVKKWAVLLIVPLLALLLVVLLQVFVRFALTDSSATLGPELDVEESASSLEVALNAFSYFAGTLAVVGLLFTPLWLIMLVRDLKGHNRSRTVAIVLAILFGLFSWIYTYEKNYKKFWTNLVLSIISAGIWSPIAWIWAIVDNAGKTEEFYKSYNNVQPPSNNYAPDNYPPDNQNSPE
jgi:hypothetical protein